MKKTLCLYFQVHQPLRLRQYRFFDIGNDHYYYDDFANRSIMRKVADRCYLPANGVLLDIIKEYGKQFKVSFSISGIAIEQFEMYAPEVLESFKTLAKTGCVEFLAETYSHSLASVKDPGEFRAQVEEHAALIKKHFGQQPVTFRNTELIYSDEIGAMVADMGYTAMLTEGAKHVLGWKRPNYIYTNAINPKLKLLLKNYNLSDDIAFRFSNRGWDQWPLTVEKYVNWLNVATKKDEIINLFMDYETFGEHQGMETGIFAFLRYLPARIFISSNFEFLTPAEASAKHSPVAPLHVPYAISWADEERDLSAWLGNELQNEAVDQLYRLGEKIMNINDKNFLQEYRRLQASDHFYYMCTKLFSDGAVHKYFTPYDSPYDAFINYMNVLSDFAARVEKPVEKTLIKIRSVSKKSLTLHSISKEDKKKIKKMKPVTQLENTTFMKKTTLSALAAEGPLPGVAGVPAKKKVAKKAAPKKKVAKKSTAKKVVKKAALKKVVKKAAPKKVVKKAAPKKVVKKAAPKKVVKKAAPKKVVKKAAPKKVVKKVAPKKVVKKVAPKKVVKKADPKKVVKKAAPKKVVKKVAPKKPAAKKVAKKK
jgi:alpha-amylase